MNWAKFIKERGVAISISWAFGRREEGPRCGKCKKLKRRHWVESHPFVEVEDKKSEGDK